MNVIVPQNSIDMIVFPESAGKIDRDPPYFIAK
jgi:hypothetical protein